MVTHGDKRTECFQEFYPLQRTSKGGPWPWPSPALRSYNQSYTVGQTAGSDSRHRCKQRKCAISVFDILQASC